MNTILKILWEAVGRYMGWLGVESAHAVAPVPMTPGRLEIQRLWKNAAIMPAHTSDVLAKVRQILANKQRYETVAAQVGVPWYFIAVVHMREATFNFSLHFANGDPLFDHQGHPLATVKVPRGLGPFQSWEDSAIAAIKHKGFDKHYHWDVVNLIENLEIWNGLGYHNPPNPKVPGDNRPIPSPYLWSMTNNYSTGKYVDDGIYDPHTVDKQVGCAAVLLALRTTGVELNEI